MRRARNGTPALPLACLLALGGCALLSPTKDVSRFYVLTPLAAPAGEAAPPGGCRLDHAGVGVGPVTLPPYLNRSHLARRVREHELAYSEVERWAGDLEENFGSVTAENLSRLCDAGYVPVYPWGAATRPRYHVVIDVTRFEADEEGTATLDARWGIRSTTDNTILVTRQSEIREVGASPGAEDAVAAMSRSVAILSRDIAGALARVRADGETPRTRR